MLVHNLPDELATLIDHTLVERRQADYKSADDRWRELKAQIAAADRTVQDAERDRAALALRSARGEQVTQAEVAAATQAVSEATAQADFVRRTEAAMEAVWRVAHDAYAIAPREAATAALAEVAALRIAAAAHLDVKRRELAEAEAGWHSLTPSVDALRRLSVGTIARRGIWRAAESARYDLPRSAADERAIWSEHLLVPPPEAASTEAVP